MNYNDINVDEILESVAVAVEQGNYRKATKKEFMEVRLAALGVSETQNAIKLVMTLRYYLKLWLRS